MSIFFEPLTINPSLIIFGAGHIAQPLCLMANLSGFSVTVCDNRKEWLTRGRFHKAHKLVAFEPSEAVQSLNINNKTYIVLVSHNHDLDEKIAFNILSLPDTPYYLGMIGSRSKKKHMIKRLTEKGIAKERIDTIHTPVGLDIGAITPEEIAISITAELVAKKRKMDNS